MFEIVIDRINSKGEVIGKQIYESENADGIASWYYKHRNISIKGQDKKDFDENRKPKPQRQHRIKKTVEKPSITQQKESENND